MTKRQSLLESLKTSVPLHVYDMIVNIMDMEDKETDRISELTRTAELNCLSKHNFDVPDYLPLKERIEFMQLENAERIKFGMKPEWDTNFINQLKA